MSPASQVSQTPSTKVQRRWSLSVVGSSVVVAGRGIGTTRDLVGITHAVVVAVVVHDEPCFAGLAHCRLRRCRGLVAVGGGVAVVVAGRRDLYNR